MNTKIGDCAPLGNPMQYNPIFKVEHCLHEKLWPDQESTASCICLKCLTICSQLDLLCRRELIEHDHKRIEDGSTSNRFEAKAMVYLDRLLSVYSKLDSPKPPISQYLVQQGISQLYPRAAAYILKPTSFNLQHNNTVMDSYFHQCSVLHQMKSLSQQINSDMVNASSHKYIAHQLALLYQCLKSMHNIEEIQVLLAIKENIEETFNDLKDSLSVMPEGSVVPRLSNEYILWVKELTHHLVLTLEEYPEQITNAVTVPAQIVSNILSNDVYSIM